MVSSLFLLCQGKRVSPDGTSSADTQVVKKKIKVKKPAAAAATSTGKPSKMAGRKDTKQTIYETPTTIDVSYMHEANMVHDMNYRVGASAEIYWPPNRQLRGRFYKAEVNNRVTSADGFELIDLTFCAKGTEAIPAKGKANQATGFRSIDYLICQDLLVAPGTHLKWTKHVRI